MTRPARRRGRTLRDVCSILAAALLALPAFHGAQAQNADTLSVTDVAAGVTHTRLVRNSGPWVVNFVRVDLRRAELGLRHIRANDSLLSREHVSAMARRSARPQEEVLAAINTDFFDVASGRSENNQVVDGEWYRGLPVTDSPFDTFDNIHTQFAFDSLRRPLLERFRFRGFLIGGRGTGPDFFSLNSAPTVATDSGGALHLYTSRFGATTPRVPLTRVSELALLRVATRGDTLIFLRSGDARRESGSAIPPGGAVVAGYGTGAAQLSFLALDDTVRVLPGVEPQPPFALRSPLALVVGGWPRILRDGINVARNSAAEEGTIERNAGVRHPRSAVGFSRDSTTLYLVTVDGRSAASAGMTIVELAELMLEMGAWDALNFDGGGSTTLVVRDRIVNTPADPAGERAVGGALLVTRRTGPPQPHQPLP